jgi:hypothetical protein
LFFLFANLAAVEEEVEELEDPGVVSMDKLRGIIAKDGPYYAVFEGSDNAYRDGHITTPPRKARPSYLFFQACYRATYLKRFPGSVQSEIMSRMGDKWRTMTEEEQAPFIQLAKEESEQFEKEREMMEKAQKPNEMWQPIRRCRMLLDHLVADGFSNIFLEPVNMAEFPDYDEYVDQPMDLGTVRTKLENRKYQAPENFARDIRKVSFCHCIIFVNLSHPFSLFLTSIFRYSKYYIVYRRSGTTAKCTIVTAQQSGMLPTTCQSNSNVFSRLGYCSSAVAIFAG